MFDTLPTTEQVESMTGPELVAAYNTLRPKKTVRRFASRTDGVRRVLAALEGATTSEKPSVPEGDAGAKVVTATGPRRRSGVLRISAVEDGKPPRPGSKREAFVRLLLRAKGVTVAEARERFGWTERDVADAARLCARRHGIPVRRDADGKTWRATGEVKKSELCSRVEL